MLDPSGEPTDLESLLSTPRNFGVDHSASEISALAVALRQDTENAIAFEVTAGELQLSASSGALSINAIEVAISDLTIPDTVLPPNGLVITDVAVTLDGSSTADAEWTTDGRRVDASIEVNLVVEWAMLRDGTSHPLADVRVSGVPLHIGVTHDGDKLDLSVSGDRTGAFWSWAETFELRDLEMSLVGSY